MTDKRLPVTFDYVQERTQMRRIELTIEYSGPGFKVEDVDDLRRWMIYPSSIVDFEKLKTAYGQLGIKPRRKKNWMQLCDYMDYFGVSPKLRKEFSVADIVVLVDADDFEQCLVEHYGIKENQHVLTTRQ
jgi:hypothetical protein